jgi:serine O-acetyltransferase
MTSPFELFRQDAQRWIDPGQVVEVPRLPLRTMLKLLYRYRSLRAMLLFRIGSWCRHKRLPALPGIIQRRIMKSYGLEILVGADIAGGLYIAHPVGCVIVPTRMGRNCSVIAAVTIGMRNEWAFPTIGDSVFIGAGARVLGAIHVGDHAVIGANAVVIHDVPAGATAVGVPARPRAPAGAAGNGQERQVVSV